MGYGMSTPQSGAHETPCRPRALVLAPTRELAIQIEMECAKLTFGQAPPTNATAGRNPRCAASAAADQSGALWNPSHLRFACELGQSFRYEYSIGAPIEC